MRKYLRPGDARDRFPDQDTFRSVSTREGRQIGAVPGSHLHVQSSFDLVISGLRSGGTQSRHNEKHAPQVHARMVIEEAPMLETARLRLRGHRGDDLASCHAMWSDPAVVRYIGGRGASLEETWTKLLRYVGHWRLRGFGYWVLEDKQTGQFIGEAGFADFKRQITPALDGIPELGWALVPAAHGRGLATEAALRILDWGSENLTSTRITCLIHPANSASLRIACKLGFRQGGTVQYKTEQTLWFERKTAQSAIGV